MPHSRSGPHLAHLADTHLGYSKFKSTSPIDTRNQRTVDFANVFSQAIMQIIDRHQVEPFQAFIHAGDIFDRPRPAGPDVAVVAMGIQALQKAGIPQLWITGNHDSSTLRTSSSFLTMLRDIFQNDQTAFAVDRDTCQLVVDDLVITGVAWDGWEDHHPADLQKGQWNVLVAHGEVSNDGQLIHRHYEPRQLPLDGYDYIALGHLHDRPNRSGPFRLQYAGAPERSGWRDVSNTAPGWLDVYLARDGYTYDVEPTAARVMRELGSLDAEDAEGAISQLMAMEAHSDDPTAIARVNIRGIPSSKMGSTRHAITQALDGRYWQLQVDFTTGGHIFTMDQQRAGPVASGLPPMAELWEHFTRESAEPFTPELVAIGLDAITRAEALVEEGAGAE